ncbi:phosphoadenylyl-sulfate reductase [Actinopolymorpha pittospori]|uniref:Adenosine 5'-phosphosulfate reductase n=1 Tax=Actinopolymorpha pittospori TaxID=648752 RepID=A0A927N536_9ACTN|nr:phosphoadenylyl-sulfate reductase [Actinopolymorpha pittospori]MBE1610438.1 phosphoadenosine phosphosulfate reductase [Actinopolymorpha pittospori]
MSLAMEAPDRCRDELEALATKAGHELADASAAEILAWAADTFGARFCVTSSMQDTVLSHLASSVAPGVDVVFLDTGYHFAETLGTADAASVVIPINLVTVRPRQTVAEQDATLGPELYRRNPELCCQLRKVAPLERALTSYDAWATGVRRDESQTRADTPVVSWNERRGKVRIAPLASWRQEDVDRYITDNGLLTNPLLDDGYPSIGCWPCTRRVAEGEDPRAGRWAGRTKTECGINT